ncbi:MAG: ATP-binding protein [Paracoccaceae bacterium]
MGQVMATGIKRRLALVLAILLAVSAICAGVWRYGYLQALDGVARQAASDLALASDRLTGQLQRYREVAVLTADRPEILAVLGGADAEIANRLLLEVSDKTSSLNLILIDTEKTIRAAAVADIPAGAIDPQLLDRALQGALGWSHGQWGDDGPRVFKFSAPIFGADGSVRAALVAIVNLGYVELDWVGSNPALFFTDAKGTVFFTNRSEITFWTRPDGNPGLVSPKGEVRPFDAKNIGRHEIWKLGWGRYLPKEAIHLTRQIPVVGFTGEVLADLAPARRLAQFQAMAVGGLCLAFGAIFFLATERRRTLAEANALLEERVSMRTSELSQANVALRREVAERIDAEKALAQAQADLVQAGKLSALGQMSAGISHELNQPLMAIQSFAENGVKFMERGKADVTRDNLGRISDMAQRMGRIIKNLRAFARQESAPADRVDIVTILDSAIELTLAHVHSSDVELKRVYPEDPIWVRGGEVRLGQVFVNLINNAVDAMAHCDVRALSIRIDHGEKLSVSFADTGPGIDMPDKVFEPFYSTKANTGHDSMGLGLSISYGIVQSFGGDIRGRNTDKGAEFTVELERWNAVQEAAE